MLTVLVMAAVLQALVLLFFTVGASRKASPVPVGTAPISVIVAAHNEAANLQKHLPTWLAQDFQGQWELILVLDRCTDASKAVVEAFRQDQPRLRVVEIAQLAQGWAPKKHALRQGIDAAFHGRLAFTDADCALEQGWLRGMDTAFSHGAELVLGTGPLTRRPGMLNALARFETWMTAVLYMGLAGWGMPYMGVGRSIGYTRLFFDRSGGFGSHKARVSGDDDLLVNSAAKGTRTALLAGEGRHAYSAAPGTWREWFSQKMRHHSAAPAYSWWSKLILIGVHGLHAIFYLSLMLVLFCSSDPVWVAVVWGCRAVYMALVLARTDWPDRNDLLLLAPVLDLLYLLYLIVIGPAGMILPPKWKGK